MAKRVYVCHTFYHVYVTLLKEFNLQQEQGDADIVLSTISSDLTVLKERLSASGVFQNVYMIDEKKDLFFPELMKYKRNCNNVVHHLYNRIIYTKKLAKLEQPYITVDFKKYKDIYVFCDSDPIGYYLNAKHIRYHAMEDGLDCLKILDAAYYDNQGHFAIKKLLARMNLIFIQNGHSKYCIDMEVNDMSCLRHVESNYIEVPRKPLEYTLNSEQKLTMLRVFMEDADGFLKELHEKAGSQDCVLFLTMPHPQEEEIRKQICNDIIGEHCQGMHVVIKPHPRDLIDYASLRPDCTTIRGKFPVEVLNFMEGVHFKKIISIATTALDTLDFADEKINLGGDFWDRYEAPEKHNWRTV